MSTKLFSLLTFLICCSSLAFGQYSDVIRSARPGQAIGPFTVGKSMFQVQSGLNIGQANYNNELIKTLSHNTVVRYGLGEKFEISSVIDWSTTNTEVGTNTNLNILQLGARYHLYSSDKRFIPSIGIQSRVLFHPSYSSKNGVNLMLIAGSSITDKLGITANLGLSSVGRPATSYVVNLGYSVNKKLEVFGEIYGQIGSGSWYATTLYFDSGFGYYFSNNSKLDWSIGYEGGWFKRTYIDFGYSFRFKTAKIDA